jgi:hypothetical protein
VHATFDAAPGGTITIEGNVLALPLDADAATLYAKTFGPFGLAESDTINNFARASFVEDLFADGFDGN